MDKIFELKINSANNNTFIIGANESGKKVIGVKYDIDKQGKRWFTYVLPQNKAEKKKNDANNQITVSSLRVFKSPDFGGGARGSGGGTAETKITESLQCYYNSYIYNTSSGVSATAEYGKVFISIKSTTGENLTITQKDQLIKDLEPFVF